MLDAGACSRRDVQGAVCGGIGTFKGIAVKTQRCRCDLQGQTGLFTFRGTIDLQGGIDVIVPVGAVAKGPCSEQGIPGVGLFQQLQGVRRLDHLDPGSGEG